MRRAPAIAAVALPAAVLAALSAGSGMVIEVDNYSTATTLSYVNAVQCSGGNLNLELNLLTEQGVTFTTGGNYRIFASTAEPTQPTGKTRSYCAEATTQDPPVTAGQVGSQIPAENAIQGFAVTGSSVVGAVSKTCAQEGQQIWICAHWYDGQGNRNGSAWGRFQIQVAAPNAPTLTSVGAGDGELIANFTAPNPVGDASVDRYAARATPAGLATPEHWSPSVGSGATSATISGLENNKDYDVVVFAYSIGGNPSVASNQLTATPLPAADFWDVYKARGGVEGGGCGTGGAGAPALLGALALAVLRRRAP